MERVKFIGIELDLYDQHYRQNGGGCRARSDCMHVQVDLALQSLQKKHVWLPTAGKWLINSKQIMNYETGPN